MIVAGNENAIAVYKVVDLVPTGDDTIVHSCMLPGRVRDYPLARRLAG